LGYVVAFGHSLLQAEVPHMKKTLIYIVLALSTLGLSPSPATGQSAAVTASGQDRKSTRLNSSHVSISYAVFCLKKKKKNNTTANCKRVHSNRHGNNCTS